MQLTPSPCYDRACLLWGRDHGHRVRDSCLSANVLGVSRPWLRLWYWLRRVQQHRLRVGAGCVTEPGGKYSLIWVWFFRKWARVQSHEGDLLPSYVLSQRPSTQHAARDLGVWNLALVVPLCLAAPVGGMAVSAGNHALGEGWGYSVVFVLASVYLLVGVACVHCIRSVD